MHDEITGSVEIKPAPACGS